MYLRRLAMGRKDVIATGLDALGHQAMQKAADNHVPTQGMERGGKPSPPITFARTSRHRVARSCCWYSSFQGVNLSWP